MFVLTENHLKDDQCKDVTVKRMSLHLGNERREAHVYSIFCSEYCIFGILCFSKVLLGGRILWKQCSAGSQADAHEILELLVTNYLVFGKSPNGQGSQYSDL